MKFKILLFSIFSVCCCMAMENQDKIEIQGIIGRGKKRTFSEMTAEVVSVKGGSISAAKAKMAAAKKLVSEALLTYEEAAEKGKPKAHYLLGLLYQEGLITQDTQKATKNFERAKELGHKRARHCLELLETYCLNGLPEELLVKILDNLPLKDIVRIVAISKRIEAVRQYVFDNREKVLPAPLGAYKIEQASYQLRHPNVYFKFENLEKRYPILLLSWGKQQVRWPSAGENTYSLETLTSWFIPDLDKLWASLEENDSTTPSACDRLIKSLESCSLHVSAQKVAKALLKRPFISNLSIKTSNGNRMMEFPLFAENMVKALEAQQNLTSLSFNESGSISNLGEQGVKALFSVIAHHKGLRKLSIWGTEISNEEINSLAEALKQNQTLTEFEFVEESADVECLENLLMALQHTTALETLKLNYALISDKFVQSLVALLNQNNTLKHLILEDSQFNDSHLKVLAGALNDNKGVNLLNLTNTHITDEGIIELSKTLLQNETLTHLQLNGLQITDRAAISLARALESNKTVTSLTLDMENSNGGVIGEAGLRAIAEMLKTNNTLKILRISVAVEKDSHTQSEYENTLAEALEKNKALTQLGLYGNFISMDGVKSLVKALEKNETLTFLNLCYENDSEEIKSLLRPLSLSKPHLKILVRGELVLPDLGFQN